MKQSTSNEPIQNEDERPSIPDQEEVEDSPTIQKKNIFTFWKGLKTVLGAAFVVATLFSLWTPGSLIDSSLEARMAVALDAAMTDGDDLVEPEHELDPSSEYERIGIVAGHYGSDPGAVCPNGVTEVELNLKIATLVQKDLTDRGFQVDLLEEFDQRLWGYKGAVVVSIHLDSCEYINDQATGFKVAAALSTQNVAASQRLTSCLSARYGEITGLPYHAGSVTDDMTYYHAFNEIDPGTMAAIIEAGFMHMDYRFITEETEVVADGIVAGILCYLNNEPIEPTQSP